MIPAPRLMAQYRDASNRVVARILQGAKVHQGRLVAVFYAEAGGDRVERNRFACATRAVNEWAAKNRVKLTMEMAG